MTVPKTTEAGAPRMPRRRSTSAGRLMAWGVRAWFGATPRKTASDRIRRLERAYTNLAARLPAGAGSVRVRVPRMPGVDEDMRDWSFFMILEHNAIVNRSITAVVESLVRGEAPSGVGAIDPKKDVMPSEASGEAQVSAFRASVEDHLAAVAAMGRLRGTRRHRHPLFGDFDAHHWHCMFGFHLMVHQRQAAFVVRKLSAEKGHG